MRILSPRISFIVRLGLTVVRTHTTCLLFVAPSELFKIASARDFSLIRDARRALPAASVGVQEITKYVIGRWVIIPARYRLYGGASHDVGWPRGKS